ncbi:uncharacterized protein LOC129596107 [Paramacrobiotus metropolitanus]|uniref:uncharacterized protein LOC129596107 n=1 Tax=Paramacrobiotus metropolitanus TaxID=2943436 RepID=UPI002445E082|nr:uncharacterized protein LOC129596107 [Paramacrobiotus metropolitanus]
MSRTQSSGSQPNADMKELMTVPYHGIGVPVFEKDNGSAPAEYFYSPLLILQRNTVKPTQNRIQRVWQATFSVLMWDPKFTSIVRDAITNATGMDASNATIQPLPIERIRLEVTDKQWYEADTKWLPFTMQETVQFTLKCADEASARELCSIIHEDTDSFLDTVMVRYMPKGHSTVTKSIAVEADKLKDNDMLATMLEQFPDQDSIYLTPDDAKALVNKMSGTLRQAESNDLKNIDLTPLVKFLEAALEVQPLKKEDFVRDLWDVLYWSNSTLRPDELAQKLNQILGESDEAKKADIQKWFKSPVTTRNKLKDKDAADNDSELASLMPDARKYTEWNGQEFVPKPMDLVQITVSKLRKSASLGTVELSPSQSDSRFCGRLRILIVEQEEVLPNVTTAATEQPSGNGVLSPEEPQTTVLKTETGTEQAPSAPTVRYLDRILAESQRITAGPPEIYQAALHLVAEDKTHMLRKFTVGTAPQPHAGSKVILVVGSTGAGKTTLINGLFNYFFGVKWTDSARLKVIVEEGEAEQAHSVTKWVSCYEAVQQFDSPSPYSLTIVDTPGFGDTAGLTRDREIVQQLKSLFTTNNTNFVGLDHIDAVCIVVQSALARLTPTQRFIFDSILSIFGKNIAKNIFLLCTFADGATPPVLAGVKAADVPYLDWFPFNNSALYADNDPNAKTPSKLYWDMGTESVQKFLASLVQVKPQSLSLTREVLKERAQLEAAVSDLQPRINYGLGKMEEIRQLQEVVKQHERKIEDNKDFSVEVDEPYIIKVTLDPGQYVTNCMVCNMTCHFPCRYANDEDKVHCSAMTNGQCVVCPKGCPWDKHCNNQFRFDTGTKKIIRTMEEIKKAYTQAKGEKVTSVTLLKRMEEHLQQVTKKVIENLFTCNDCLNRLDQIALRPNVMATAQYVEILIETEKSEKRPNFMQRIAALEEAKKKAIFIEKARQVGGRHDPKNILKRKDGWLEELFGGQCQ